MKKIDELFFQYTKPFKKYGSEIDLKINHTVRVKDLCIDIAKSLNLSEEDQKLAAVCGYLHDIGRFEQWKKYKTYNDMESIDHGNLGVEVLEKEAILVSFNKKDQNTITQVVKYHNKYKVPNTISERNKQFINIVRDADKIDILDLFATNQLSVNTKNTNITKKVWKTLMNKQLVSIYDLKTKADAFVTRIGFIFDMNYQRSFEILKERNLINKIIDNQLKETNNEEFINQLKELKKECNNYIEERIIC